MYSLDGIVVFSLLVICTCAYMKRVPRLKGFFLSEKKGFFGVFYKGQSSGPIFLQVAFAVSSNGPSISVHNIAIFSKIDMQFKVKFNSLEFH